MYFVGGRVEVCVDGRGIHLPRLGIALLANPEPRADLVRDPAEREGEERKAFNLERGCPLGSTYSALSMFSKNVSFLIVTREYQLAKERGSSVLGDNGYPTLTRRASAYAMHVKDKEN